MSKLVRRIALLVLAFFYSCLLANHSFAASPNVNFVFDVANGVSGVTPQARAQITYGTNVLQLEVKAINLPDGTQLDVIFTEHDRVDPYGPLAPVTIGSITINRGDAKVKMNFADMIPGTIDGLEIRTADGTLLLHAFPMVKN